MPKSVNITLFAVTILAISLILLVLELKEDIHTTTDHVNFTLSKLDTALANLQAVELNTTRTEAEMAGLLNTTRHIALKEREAQEEQLHAIQLVAIKAYNVLDDADQTIKQVGAVAPVLAESIQDTTEDVQLTLKSTQKLLEATTDDVSSPAIKNTMERVEEASKNTAEATANVAAATQDIRDYVHRETTPVRGFWNAVKALINLTWSIRGAAGI